jgi:hypothetical protein
MEWTLIVSASAILIAFLYSAWEITRHKTGKKNH